MVTFRGHETARIDDKGRLKIPAKFKRALTAANATTLFTTAITNEALSIYPLAAWEEIEAKVKDLGMLNPKRRMFDRRVHYFGSEVDMDSQGRISLKAVQRKLLNDSDEVVLLGCMEHIQVYAANSLNEEKVPEELTNMELGEMGI
ncbi:MAG: hypothetical protein CSA81_09420 [Acidobacteria bacterium]|nr:MAG: hypothetical protein CSA81_09420 [Acidobacteriota bacterium]PIE89656.1 MAG: hypothetical protein CR997_10050 [Acidobacteriota bacterium]